MKRTKKYIEEFIQKCSAKLEDFDPDNNEKLLLPGNRPYRAHMKPSMAPEADKNCTKCRTCVKVCPVHAINSETPRKTDKKEVHYVYRLYRKLYSKKHGLLAGRNTLSHQKTFASACSKRKSRNYSYDIYSKKD